ncbi:Accelerated cell death 11 isoform C [Glycine soja]|uniref:Accelerated cell death 11 isoform C n=1 Tax=Glycine soja TaxID=3848 RepID=A0A445IVY9_GLYSO|nr:Accelerated cell death 11 isoform C [Glycine soja]
MAEGNGDKTLRKIAEAFKDLANVVTDSQSAEVKVSPFSHACSLVSPLFGCLGVAFKFAEMDYVAKVNDLVEASKCVQNLQSLIELDVQANTVRKGGSHTRNLLRVKRGLDMVRVLFEQILVTELPILSKIVAAIAVVMRLLRPLKPWCYPHNCSRGPFFETLPKSGKWK